MSSSLQSNNRSLLGEETLRSIGADALESANENGIEQEEFTDNKDDIYLDLIASNADYRTKVGDTPTHGIESEIVVYEPTEGEFSDQQFLVRLCRGYSVPSANEFHLGQNSSQTNGEYTGVEIVEYEVASGIKTNFNGIQAD